MHHILENNLQRNNVESRLVHSVHQNSPVATLQCSLEVVSVPQNLENVEGPKGLPDDFDLKLMVVAELTKKLKSSGFEHVEKENKFFDQVTNGIQKYMMARKALWYWKNGSDICKRYLMLWKFLITNV